MQTLTLLNTYGFCASAGKIDNQESCIASYILEKGTSAASNHHHAQSMDPNFGTKLLSYLFRTSYEDVWVRIMGSCPTLNQSTGFSAWYYPHCLTVALKGFLHAFY